MNQHAVTMEVRLRERAEIIRECRSSGMTVSTWCRERGISKGTYYRWQRQVREAACARMPEIQPSASQTALAVSGFTEVRMTEAPPPLSGVNCGEGQLHITVGGVQISADAGYPLSNLAALLRELSQV